MQDYYMIFVDRAEDITEALLRHVMISGIAIILSCLVAVPLGVYLSKTSQQWLRSIVFTITNIFQTIPSLAMLALFIPILGIGLKPAIIALFLYSLLPILRNTYAAFESIDDEVVEAATGMGFNTLQKLIQVEIPLAMPYIMSGIRLTTVYIINWATLAALIGAGGLGQLIIGGMGVNNKPLIMAAALLAILLALVIDLVLSKVENIFLAKTKQGEKAILTEE